MIAAINDMPVLASILTFCSLFLLVIGVAHYLQMLARKDAMIEKIREAGDSPTPAYREPASPVRIEEKQSDHAKFFLDLLGAIGKRLAPEKKTDYRTSRIKFLNAGVRHPNAATIFIGAKLFFIAVCLSLFLFARVTVIRTWPLQLTVLMGITAAVIGLYIPEIWLDVKTAKRRNHIFAGLPDALDLMVVCVEAGMGLDAAMTRVSREIHMTCPPLSQELWLMNLELRAGKSRENALKNLAFRVGLEDMTHLTTMLIQSERFGTSSSRALRVYSDTFRSRRFSKAEEQAAKVSIKLLFPLIFFIFPALFVVVAGPAMIRVYEALIK